MATIAERARSLLSPKKPFGQVAEFIRSWDMADVPYEEQHILRMMIRTPNSDGFQIPPELEWLRPTIYYTWGVQEYDKIPVKFVYVTVRHGMVKSVTDDQWHVDGFSMRIPHIPEQNYIWTSSRGTQMLDQEIELPDDFDPFKHNIHLFFQAVAKAENVRIMTPRTLWRIDPYVVHRRPQVPLLVRRTFFRISFVPVEIEDDTCTINPLIPREKPYGRKDIRSTLKGYYDQT